MSAAVTGSVMILAILALRAGARKRLPAGLFRALWILTAARMLMPKPFTLTVTVPAPMQQSGYITKAVTLLPTAGAAADAAISPEAVLRIVHLAGIAVTAGFFLFAYARLRTIAHRGERTLVRGVWVQVGEGFSSPFSCGILRPVIYLPAQMLTLSEEQLDCILAHERAHIKRLDQPVKWLILAAVCVHWWNPAVWLMLRYASRDIELACDAVVARHTDASAYAMCLIAAEEVRSMPEVNAFGAPAIHERIECIMKKKHLTVCSFICAALILGAATPFFVDVEAVWEPASIETDRPAVDLTGLVPDEIGTYQYEILPEDTAGKDVSYEIAGEETMETVVVYTSEQAETDETKLVFPLNVEYRVSQGYSDRHPAVDAAAAEGSEILAVLDGTVTAAGYDYTLGNHVEIAHSNGLTSLYAHCEKLAVEVGDTVAAGDVIAWVGKTGAATGAHLHFAMSSDGTPILPEGLFN